MDASEQINNFFEFLDSIYKAELLEQISKGHKFLNIEFNELSKFSPELAEELLDNPEDVIKAAEIAVERFETDGDTENFVIRFSGLPDSQHTEIRNVRSKHLGKFLQIKGLIRQKSDVRPQVTSAKFECPSCGNVLSVLQLEQKFKEPTSCGCGRKGKFKLLSKELVDAQKIVLEEAPEDLEGSEQPKRMNIFLKNDLTSPMSERQTNPGSKIKITGVLNEVPLPAKDGGKLTRFDLMIDVNHTTPIEQDFSEIFISKEEEEEIKNISKDKKIYEKFVNSIAPSIYGYDKVKLALLLQLMGGVKKVRSDGIISRGDMHILLVGDPGAGKSQLLKRMDIVAPKSRYVVGKSASGAGLTATVVRDDFLGGWALEAGALVLANKGMCMIDEMDKMDREDSSAMHEALEQQTISISKANIQATLHAETTVLAAANPKFGRFDPYELIAKQIDMPPTLLNRFDLIFPIKDIPGKEKDSNMAKFILSLHKDVNLLKGKEDIPTDTIKKYVAYARQMCHPKLTDEAISEIQEYYVKMRTSGSDEESAIRAIPITARQLEALVRLAEASARVRLSNKVTKEDSKRSIELVHYSLSQIGLDPETGKIDIDRISSSITASDRSAISVVKEIINDLESSIGKSIPIDEIIRSAEAKEIEREKVEEVIEKLKRAGDIFEPKRGTIQKL
ncbi:minichromosome maintenance protein MCM [Candidatus Woesearchaeota archaeon]|nr:minichromosome maintenance protein MCM [Candidatus Woesearchaeota archaeon]